MTAILDVVIPVFAIMLAGYLCGRFGLLGEASSEALNRFVYYVAMPALFVVSMSRVSLAEAFNGPFLLAFGGGMAITGGIAIGGAAWLFPNRLGALGLHGLAVQALIPTEHDRIERLTHGGRAVVVVHDVPIGDHIAIAVNHEAAAGPDRDEFRLGFI